MAPERMSSSLQCFCHHERNIGQHEAGQRDTGTQHFPVQRTPGITRGEGGGGGGASSAMEKNIATSLPTNCDRPLPLRRVAPASSIELVKVRPVPVPRQETETEATDNAATPQVANSSDRLLRHLPMTGRRSPHPRPGRGRPAFVSGSLAVVPWGRLQSFRLRSVGVHG